MKRRLDKKFEAFDVKIWLAQNKTLAIETLSLEGIKISDPSSVSSARARKDLTSLASGISRSVNR